MKYTGINSIRKLIKKTKELLNSKADKSHTHTKSNITDFSHTHTKSNITDFSHTHTKSNITDFSHTHTKSNITDFSHTHTKSNITDFSHTHTKSEVGLSNVDNVKQYSANNKPPYPVTKVNNKTGSVTLNYNDVGAVQNSGVKGEDGSHKMALSWAVDHVIVGIDNNAAVVHLMDMSDTGWINAWTGTNWVTDGSKPFDNRVRKIGKFVTIKYDLTARITINARDESAAKSFIYNIGADKRPSQRTYFSGVTTNGKPYCLWIDGQDIKVFGNDFSAGDRFIGTILYLI